MRQDLLSEEPAIVFSLARVGCRDDAIALGTVAPRDRVPMATEACGVQGLCRVTTGLPGDSVVVDHGGARLRRTCLTSCLAWLRAAGI